MQMVKKIILVMFLLWFAILIFMPKRELYYALEKSIESKDIRLNEQSIETGIFSLEVNDITIYVKGVKVARLKRLNVFTLLFYTHIKLENLVLNELLKDRAPKNADEINLVYQVFSPLTIGVDSNGSFGTVKGKISLSREKINLRFIKIGEISNIQGLLNKDDKGWFYEKSF